MTDSFWENPCVLSADEIWPMGVWKNSPASRTIASAHSGLQKEYRKALSNFQEKDVIGSPYAVFSYDPNEEVSSIQGLIRFRDALHSKNKKLILDFVPNHLAIDSPYIDKFPDCFLKTNKEDQNSFRHANGNLYVHGKDPYFDGWTDTIQWDFSKEKTILVHENILIDIASICDGVRCDMAMLALSDVFERTHGIRSLPYWERVIGKIKSIHPDFKFYAEAYWDKEYELQCLGFDGTYDKTLYDQFSHSDGIEVTGHLEAEISYQNKSIRFLENHDEERAALHFGNSSCDKFAILCFLPGIILYHSGQELGYTIKVPIQLGRMEKEKISSDTETFYKRVFEIIRNRKTEIKRTSPVLQMFDQGTALCYVLEYETSKELLIWNPENFPVSGRIQLPMKEYYRENLKDQVSGKIFQIPKSEMEQEGMFFSLNPKESQWFIF
ncbi:alpha-amylase [Leptospira sp. 'Mane']|uniref:alpha-amylase n=1 Tax=Leptospira sp. 'Mane' TaxID=3387407 RepID=UPI00398A8C45